MNSTNRVGRSWVRVPVYGLFVFAGLYFIATILYPGGSQADNAEKEFSWLNNYWCDLLSEKSKNGLDNTARPVAVISWLILCFSLSVFWYFLPVLFLISAAAKNLIRFTGIIAMLIAAFLFTSLHDVVIHSAGLFGFIAFTGTFAGLYKTGLYGFFYSGLFCLALMVLNYGIMVGNTLIFYLPLVQKVTFVFVLIWIYFIHRKLILFFSEGDP